MKLIKQIKEAEAQAGRIIEEAKAEAVQQAEQAKAAQRQALARAEQQRKEAIEKALAEATASALAEVENLKAQAEKDRHGLRRRADAKMSAAVEKIMDYLNG